MSVEQNKQIMKRMIEEVWNKGNLLVADELFAPTHTSPSAPDLPPGPESVKMLVTMLRKAASEIPSFPVSQDRPVISA